VFISPSWRYADPRAGLLTGQEWKTARPMICRSLACPVDPTQTLLALTIELDQTYHALANRLPNNPAVRFETVDGKKRAGLDSTGQNWIEPESLVKLREAVAASSAWLTCRNPYWKYLARTGFTDAFTHLTERTARAQDLSTSLCEYYWLKPAIQGLNR